MRTRNVRHQWGERWSRSRLYKFSRTWAWEIPAIFFAIGFLVAMFAILFKLDDLEDPLWPSAINLNTVVAIISTNIRANLMLIFGSIISQEKWRWFSAHPRPMYDLTHFDEASRNLVGAVGLMNRLRLGNRGSIISVLASAASIVSLATGSFSQQAVKKIGCSRVVIDGSTFVPIARSLPGPADWYWVTPRGDPEDEFPSSWRYMGAKLKAAMVNGIFLSNDMGESLLTFGCQSGNCTFAAPRNIPHSTLGMCSSCRDVTGVVPSLQVWSTSASEPWLESKVERLQFDKNIQLFANVTIRTQSGIRCRNCNDTSADGAGYALSVNCILYPCLQDIDMEIKQGKVREAVMKTEALRRNLGEVKSDDADYFPFAIKSPCLTSKGKVWKQNAPFPYLSNTTLEEWSAKQDESLPAECLFTIHCQYLWSISEFLAHTLLNGSAIYDVRNELYFGDQWWLENLYYRGDATIATIDSVFKGLSRSATVFFRNNGWGPERNESRLSWDFRGDKSDPYELYTTGTHITGQSEEYTVCVQVQWAWLLFPAALCSFTVLLLVMSIYQNSKDSSLRVWQASLLPLLFYGLREEERSALSPSNGFADLYNLEEIAKKRKIWLQHGDGTEPRFAFERGSLNCSERGDLNTGSPVGDRFDPEEENAGLTTVFRASERAEDFVRQSEGESFIDGVKTSDVEEHAGSLQVDLVNQDAPEGTIKRRHSS